MKHVKIRKIGNSLGVILPKDVLDHLNASEGDDLTFSETEHGVHLEVSDPETERMLSAAEKIMEKRFKVLKVLAK